MNPPEPAREGDEDARRRTVILLRHGKSSWSDPSLADIDRPLARRGERAAKRVARHMRQEKIRPGLVLCSPSLRTRQTLDAITSSLNEDCAVELVPELYAAPRRELLACLRSLPDSVASVLVIGHNPGLQDLALFLAVRGADLSRLAEKLPTGALATLALFSSRWATLSEGDAELVDYFVPREPH